MLGRGEGSVIEEWISEDTFSDNDTAQMMINLGLTIYVESFKNIQEFKM